MLNQFHLAWFLQRLFVIQVSIHRFKLFFGATWQKIETMGLMLIVPYWLTTTIRTIVLLHLSTSISRNH